MLSNFMKKGNNLQERGIAGPQIWKPEQSWEIHPQSSVEIGEAPSEQVPGLRAWEAWRGSALHLESSAGFCSWCA